MEAKREAQNIFIKKRARHGRRCSTSLCILCIALLLCITVSSASAGSKKDMQQNTEEEPVLPDDGSLPEAPSAQIEQDVNRPAYFHDLPTGDPVTFHEVWGYVMVDREYEYDPSMPITDLCYFGVEVNAYGELEAIPNVSKVKGFKGRTHLVAACSSRSLTHFVLDPQYGVREKVIDALAKATSQYDGIQIDYELVPARDAKNFRTFLSDIRAKIGKEKWLTVCVPARVKDIKDDIYNYKALEPLVDRVIIMAYDQHWSTSEPGAVAGMDWCRRIADYAVTVLPKKKLVMGLPFYGRTWQDTSYGKAWYFSGVNRIMNENDMHVIEREDGVPHFTFKTEVTVTGYFDDTYSLVERSRMYQSKNIDRIAFWRIGQEDPSFWPWLTVK